jgi:diguanylate cyclase (GGDEF)-like protein
MVKQLYLLSQRSMIAVIAFAVFVSYFLYPVLKTPIMVWGVVLILIALLRLVLVYYFRENEKRYKIETWYKIFLLLNFTTALHTAILGAYFIYDVNDLQILFIVTVLLGISSGGMNSLYPDIRIMLGYITIIIFPLIVSLFLLGGETNTLLAMMLILYFLTQLVVVFNAHKLYLDLETKQKEVIATQAQLIKNKETLEYFYTQAPIPIFSYGLDLKVTECNEAFLKLFRLEREEVIGLDLKLLPDKSPLKISQDALKHGVQNYVGPYLSTKGIEYWVEAKAFPVYNEHDAVIGGIILIEDKTNEHKAIERLKYLASHDALTQLSNRRGFSTFMEKLVQDSRHQDHYSLLFYLDLNRFKYINDSLGHTFGDRLLQSVARRLESLVDKGANLTRLGGDEFVIVIPFIAKKREATKSMAEAYVKKVHEAFEEAFIIDGVRLYVKTSIGIVMIEPKFDNVEEIVRHADISMYQAKKDGDAKISFYNNSLDEMRKETFSLQQDLIYALENDLFELFLQPILNIDNDRVNAAEALIRWNHPTKGLLQPDDFIPLAIELGVVTEIGWWVLKKTCQIISQWKEQGVWDLEYISINLNAKQLIKENFVERFFNILKSYNVDMQDIKVEITETSLIDNFELTQQVIHELQGRGIKCIIDDFGTGYSSLSYLKKLSFSVLKIDKEFIFDLEHNEDNETLIRTIVEIAKQFKYSIVVEGIETSEQKEIIRSIDHNLSYQGFLTSKPIPIEDFKEKFIEDRTGNKE